MSCNELPLEDLVAWIDGELATSDAERVEEHVASCAGCAAEAAALRRVGDLVAALPRIEPAVGFPERVVAAARTPASPPGGVLRRLWPAAVAAAAAAILVAAFVAPDGAGTTDADVNEILSAAEERAIAEDLLVLSNLEALEIAETDELISLVEALDLIESLEPEETGAFASEEREGG